MLTHPSATMLHYVIQDRQNELRRVADQERLLKAAGHSMQLGAPFFNRRRQLRPFRLVRVDHQKKLHIHPPSWFKVENSVGHYHNDDRERAISTMAPRKFQGQRSARQARPPTG